MEVSADAAAVGRVRNACAKLGVKNSLMIVSQPELLSAVRLSVLKELLAMGHHGVYISLSKPHTAIEHMLEKHGIDTSKMYYVDCISTSAHPRHGQKHSRVLHVASPERISDAGVLSGEIERFIRGVSHPKFIVVDTIRTMSLYHHPKVVASLVSRLEKIALEIRAKLVLLTIPHGGNVSLHALLPLFDMVIDISGSD
ncbi:MAG: hypothetical protein PHG85_02305 [Candidatus Altiarchaeota archaeon]|nr:hypothetical protein [Candidatus Altiarchaeota archaeon]